MTDSLDKDLPRNCSFVDFILFCVLAMSSLCARLDSAKQDRARLSGGKFLIPSPGNLFGGG